MGSPFKMNPKTPFMKALVGKQGNLPQQLQDAIKAAPEDSPAKSYGKSPMKKTDKKEENVAIGKSKTTKTKSGTKTTTPVERVKGEGTADAARKGVSRLGTETVRKAGSMTKKTTKLSGTSGFRGDGSGYVKEATVSAIKPKGAKVAKLTADKKIKSKGKSPAKMKGVKGLKK